MTAAIEFWFDFSSPYAYFAAEGIGRLSSETGRQVLWRPFLLGAVFKQTGMRPLVETPLRGDYARRDWPRLARLLGLRFEVPPRHPIAAVAASRAFYWVERTHPGQAPSFARAVFRAYYADGRDVSEPSVVAEIAAKLGLPGDALTSAIQSPEAKAELRARTEEAIARSIFGSPTFIVDDEPFWGWDRMPLVREWITRGGW